MLNQVGQHLIGEAVLVGPGSVAEDAVQRIRVGLFNSTHRVLQGEADVDGDLAHIVPVRAVRDDKMVVLRKGGIGGVAIALSQSIFKLLVVDI